MARSSDESDGTHAFGCERCLAGTSRKGRSWRRDAKTIGNVCSCSRLFRIRRHWTDECVGPVLRMHHVNSSARRVLFPKDAEYW